MMKYLSKILVILLVVLMACENLQEDLNEQNYVNPVKIGVVGDVTILREVVENILFAVNMAAQEINNQGGLIIDGEHREIELIFKNSGASEEKAIEVVDELIDEGVEIIIGPTISSVAIPMAQYCIEKNVLLMTYSATVQELTFIQDNNLIWRTCPSDYYLGKVMGIYAHNNLDVTRAAIYYRDDTFGHNLKNVIKEYFEGQGGTITAEYGYPADVNLTLLYDFEPDLNNILRTEPQAIFTIVFATEIIKISQELYSLPSYQNLNCRPVLFLNDGVAIDEVLDYAQPLVAESIIGITSTFQRNPNYLIFRNNYINNFGFGPSTYAEHAYDALYSLAFAMVRGQSTSPDVIKNHLAAVTGGINAPLNTVSVNVSQFSTGRDLLLEGNEIDYDGASGPISFDINGDPIPHLIIWGIENGEYKEIDVIEEYIKGEI